ncbi:type II toxin-antitoxin system CcdA family antitoxin [Sphingopyxis granuli]|uniref:type II toxin-antitoxin system CcdA family antitoxin n=1 Tax=Sphingopyxis granuli TaxID=267128 RepID=UPI001F52F1C8|nr:type II toxin-antitoxin system CcdA family antitoxin [Sphingopyxis granuli]UNK80262.1 type II toxin-antitoxin system CcdA family antitoxin [Sphingopyxis granuli]
MNRPIQFSRAPFDGPKKATNVSLNADLVDEAKRLGINVSEACQTGLAAEVKKARKAAWQEENSAAIEASNEYVRKQGLPLAKYRLF